MTSAQEYLASHPAEDGVVYVVRSLLKANGCADYSSADLKTLREVNAAVAEMFEGMDELAVGYYVNLLGREFKPKARWAKLAKSVTDAHAEKEKREAVSTTVIGGRELAVPDPEKDAAFALQLREFGVGRSGGVLWRLNGAGHPELLSNFNARGLFFVATDGVTHRLIEIEDIAGDRQYIELAGTDKSFKTESDARLFFGRFGNYEFWGGKDDTIGLWRMLLGECVRCTGIAQLGWQEAGFWVWANGVYVPGEGYREFSPYGTVTVRGVNYYCATANKINAHAVENRNRLKFAARFGDYTFDDWQSQFLTVYGANGRVGLLFLLVSLFRDVVQEAAGMVPILNAFGKCGTGKSVMLRSLERLFFKNPVLTNLANSTLPSLDNAVHEYRNVPIAFDEYSVGITRDKVEFIKSLFDGGGRVKTIASAVEGMRYNSQSEINSSVCIAGQQIPDADAALLTRIISLEFTKSTYSDEEQDDLETLQAMEQEGLSNVIHTILDQRAAVASQFNSVYMETRRRVRHLLAERGVKPEERLVSTWSILLAMYKILRKELNLGINPDELLDIATRQITTQIGDLQEGNDLTVFWSIFADLAQHGELTRGADYRVEHTSGAFECDNHKTVTLSQGEPLLYINMQAVYSKYSRQVQQQGGYLSTPTTIRKYLRSSEGFLSARKSQRWDVVTKTPTHPNDGERAMGFVWGKAWVFRLSEIDIPIAFPDSDPDAPQPPRQYKSPFEKQLEKTQWMRSEATPDTPPTEAQEEPQEAHEGDARDTQPHRNGVHTDATPDTPPTKAQEEPKVDARNTRPNRNGVHYAQPYRRPEEDAPRPHSQRQEQGQEQEPHDDNTPIPTDDAPPEKESPPF